MIRYNSVAYADIEGDLAVTQCYQNSMEFPRVHRRVVEARFDGGEITCDGGALLLRQADRYLGLTQAVAEALSDPRRRKSCAHDVRSLVRQRVYAVALGYEDLNDHDTLRREVGLQTVVERDRPLASASTLCRFEKRADRAAAWRLHPVLLEQFIAGLGGGGEGTDIGLRRHRRSGARRAGGSVFPRVLPPVLFFAAVCVLRGSVAGQLPTAVQHRCGQTQLGGVVLVGPAAAPSVAGGADYLSGRQWVLPLEAAALVRASRCGLHRGAGEERAVERAHRCASARSRR